MEELTVDGHRRDIFEEANFTDKQFDLMLEWIEERRFFELEIMIEASDALTEKPLYIQGTILKSYDYKLYKNTILIFVENIISEDTKLEIPYFLKITKSSSDLFKDRLRRTVKRGRATLLKNFQVIVENVVDIVGVKGKKIDKHSLIVKNYTLLHNFVEDKGFEIVFIREDLKKAFEWVNNQSRRYDIKVIVSGDYIQLGKSLSITMSGNIIQPESEDETIYMEFKTILDKFGIFFDEDAYRRKSILNIYLHEGDKVKLSNNPKEDGLYPEFLFLKLDKHSIKADHLIEVKDLTISFGDRVIINKASFNVEKGSIIGIIGESGGGKSTTVKAILGELKYEGSIKVMGIDAYNTKQIAPFVGYVPQDLSLMYHDFTPMENIIHFGRQYGLDEKNLARKAKRLLTDLQIPQFMAEPLGNLSGGQKRRVSVAIAMVHEPEIIILDEPTSGLDPMIRFELWKYLDWINKTYGITLIVISHYLDEIEYSDKSAVYLKGVGMFDFDTPENLKASLPGGGTSLEISLDVIDLKALPIIKEIEGVDEVIQRGERIRVLSDTYSPELKETILKKLEENNIKIYEAEEGVVVDMVDYFTIKSSQLGSGRIIEETRRKIQREENGNS
ncbi:MAG: ATP-binding cassette domain-containing protein [Promethearchaeota archaeon]